MIYIYSMALLFIVLFILSIVYELKWARGCYTCRYYEKGICGRGKAPSGDDCWRYGFKGYERRKI